MKNKYNYLRLLILCCALITQSCKQFLDVGAPKDKIAPFEVFENDEIASSAITGIYGGMANTGFASGDNGSVTQICALSANELISYNSGLDEFIVSNIPPNSSKATGLWSRAYYFIYSSNAILEGLEAATGVSANTKTQLRGEAKFIRAFCYFYLVNLFGEVPLNLTTDYKTNQYAKKSSIEKIYEQIILDLKDAEKLLAPTYITKERIRPNSWTAKALLSRVYLYVEDWENAILKSTEVIDQKSLYNLLEDLDGIFLKNSTETIWQLMPPKGGNTREGSSFILTNTPSFVSLDPSILSAFEAEDNRKTKWIKAFSNSFGNYFHAFKYKVYSSTTITEYSTVMRLAELYLIRSEAYAKQKQADLSLNDINLIRKRAGLIDPLIDFTPEQCLIEIEQQRRLELFTEWGHRWFDLKRTGRSTAVLSPLKPNWVKTAVLFPIPYDEMNRNPNVKPQNPGY